MLQRTRELAIQASNGTLTPSDRKAITDEVAQLKAEIDRISEHIEYNERKLLNGEIDRRAFSSKEGVAEVVSMSDTVEPGVYKFSVTTAAKQATLEAELNGVTGDAFGADNKMLIGGTININGEQIEIKKGDDPETVFSKIRDLCEIVGINVSADSLPLAENSKLTFISKEYGTNQKIEITGGDLLLKALDISETVVSGADVALDTTTIAPPANGFSVDTTYKISNGNIVTFEGSEGFKLKVKTGEVEEEVSLNLLKTGPLDLQIGANEGQMMQLRIQNMSTTALGLDNMNLNTAAKSQEAITLIDAAIAQVSSTRSKLGAYQNRLEHTVANLDVAAENMTASMSRIQDADMAKEMADYTKDNILAQAGNAMLAQANQRPQQILQLLQ